MEEKITMRSEGDLAFPAEENDTTSESSPETNETEETEVVEQNNKTDEPKEEPEKEQPEEKIVPLHKDERFREVLEENKKMKEQINELSDFRTKVEPLLEQKAEVNIPDWFGGSEEQYRSFKEEQQNLVKQAKEEALQEFNENQSKQSKAFNDANQYLEDSLKEIEEESGEKVDRNKLLKIVQDKELIDSKGRWNYKAGAEFLKLSEKPRNNTELNEKKKLAASTTSDDKPETQPKDFKTQEDFRVNKPW